MEREGDFLSGGEVAVPDVHADGLRRPKYRQGVPDVFGRAVAQRPHEPVVAVGVAAGDGERGDARRADPPPVFGYLAACTVEVVKPLGGGVVAA